MPYAASLPKLIDELTIIAAFALCLTHDAGYPVAPQYGALRQNRQKSPALTHCSVSKLNFDLRSIRLARRTSWAAPAHRHASDSEGIERTAAGCAITEIYPR